MQFVAYSNVNLEKVRENSPRAAEKGGFLIGSLAGTVGASSNSFVNQMKAKTGDGQSGLFGKSKSGVAQPAVGPKPQ
jgi:hypothetical protein